MAKKCGGLPLALITVGRATADARTDEEWDAALETLKGAAAEVEIKEVRKTLKFSFDRHKPEGNKECFLYCSLFPEDSSIRLDDLIEYWVGDGILGTPDCPIRTARARGQKVITDLKAACLTEDGE